MPTSYDRAASNKGDTQQNAPELNAPSRKELNSNGFTMADFANQFATCSLSQLQKNYISAVEEKLVEHNTSTIIEKDEISIRNVRSVIFYKLAEDKSKIYAAFLLFADGVELAPANFNMKNEKRIDLPIDKFNEIIERFKQNLVDKGINVPIEVIITLTVTDRDIQANKIEQMSRYIGRNLKFFALSVLNSEMDVTKFKGYSCKVTTTSATQVSHIIAQNNPLSVSPAIEVGFSVDLIPNDQNNDMVITNFITVGAIVDFARNTQFRRENDPEAISTITLTAIDSSLPMSSSMLVLAMIFAQQILLQSGVWKDKCAPHNKQNHLSKLFGSSTDPLLSYEDDYTYNEALRNYVQTPLIIIDIPFGSYRPAILSKLLSNAPGQYIIDAITQFFKPMVENNYRYNVDPKSVTTILEDLKTFEVFKPYSSEYGGYYDDPHEGNNNDIRGITFSNLIFNSPKNFADPIDIQKLHNGLCNYNTSTSAIAHADAQCEALQYMHKTSNTVRFTHWNCRYYINSNFQSVVYDLCGLARIDLQLSNFDTVINTVQFDTGFLLNPATSRVYNINQNIGKPVNNAMPNIRLNL